MSRSLFVRWGFRRIEDICWIKTNMDPNRKYLIPQNQKEGSLLAHTKVTHGL